MSTVNDIKLRSDNNQEAIKSKLKSLENILTTFDNAKEQLIDAIILDAAESINYWQDQVKKTKLQIESVFKAYISVVQAQEKTKAALNILKDKYETQKDNMINAAQSKTSDRWPNLWGKDKSILPLKDNKMTFDSQDNNYDQQDIGQLNQNNNYDQQDIGQLNQNNNYDQQNSSPTVSDIFDGEYKLNKELY